MTIAETVAIPVSTPRNGIAAFGGGAIIGALGGLIGLGGAEFRLPLLSGAFRFAALQAVILNKAMSLIVVASALPFRAAAVPFGAVAASCQSSRTFWLEACSVPGLARDGRRGSNHRRFIA